MGWICFGFVRKIFRFLRYRYRILPSKHFLVLKTSSRRLEDTSWKHLQDISQRCPEVTFSVTISCLPRRFEDDSKTSWKMENCCSDYIFKTYSKYVLKTSSTRFRDQQILLEMVINESKNSHVSVIFCLISYCF